MDIEFQNIEGLKMLSSVGDATVDFVLTDPPYIISRKSGMDDVFTGKSKSKYGRKYAIKTDYGKWDSEFTLETLSKFVNEFHRVLKKGGSCIIFFDLWKLETLSNLLTEAGFCKLRYIEWMKTNPVPINSKSTYLNNTREVAISCVKGSGQTFNSKYDNGIYSYPINQGQRGIDRFHPTQKSLELFAELIRKHTNEGDTVLDPFGGSATTYIASMMENRKCISCEIDPTFYKKCVNRIKWHKTEMAKNVTADDRLNEFIE